MNPAATPHHRPRPDAVAWPALCASLGGASLIAWSSGSPAALDWEAATWKQTPWVLWTACLVHLSFAHLLVNLAALVLMAVLGNFLHAGRLATLALFAAWPLGTLGLLWWPQITGYSGMSGLLHAMVAVLWVHAVIHAAKPLSFIIFAALGIKLLGEHAWSQPIAFDPNWGFNVVYGAHLAGAVAGAACGLLFMAAGGLTRRRQR